MLRQSAFALDAVLLEVCFIVGPLVNRARSSAAGSPAAAVLVNAGFSTVGTLVFAATARVAVLAWHAVDHAHGRARCARAAFVLLLIELAFGVADRRDGDLGNRVCAHHGSPALPAS